MFAYIIPIAFMGILGLLLATVLAIANKHLYFFEDPRVDEVEEMLPHANCGACGAVSCRAFAEKLVEGKLQPSNCTVNSMEMNRAIANFLNIDVGGGERLIARLACAGGSNVTKRYADYEGLADCRAAAQVSGAGKGCTWGCLGYGDCAEVCDFDAIMMNALGLPVVSAKLCTACGDCIKICPRDLFSLQPADHRLWVACKNLEKGEAAEKECAVACIACGHCAVDAPEGLIMMRNNLAEIDYSKNSLSSRTAIERCPTGAIVWLEDGLQKGHDAVKIIRKGALPIDRFSSST